MDGGEAGSDDDVMKESLARHGAVVMGRRMFSGGAGPWEYDPNADGWWGDEPPFRVPVFILTHHAREPVTKQGGTTFTFVTGGIEAALEQARAAAGDRDVLVAGGADAVQQYLRAALFDELQIHLAPVLLGGGVRLLDNLGDAKVGLELDQVVDSPAVTHLRYRIVK
jgi:dihydrofolate reductase